MQSHLTQYRLPSAAILRFETARSFDAGRDEPTHAGEIRRAFGALLT
jgi:hypothetical protein